MVEVEQASAQFGVGGDIRFVTIDNGGSGYASPTGVIRFPPTIHLQVVLTYEDVIKLISC